MEQKSDMTIISSAKSCTAAVHVVNEDKQVLVSAEKILQASTPVLTIYDLKGLILSIHGHEIPQQMLCLDKILFADNTLLSDLKAQTVNVTTVNSKKEGEAPGRYNVLEPLQLTLKLAQAKCQLNIDIVAEKYQAGSTQISERLQVYSTVSVMHLKKMIS
jgi:hypothetical protein